MPVMHCILILPFRERVIIISQKYFGLGVVVFVRSTKDCVERNFPPKQLLEDVPAKVRSEAVFLTRRAESYLLGSSRRAEENLVM